MIISGQCGDVRVKHTGFSHTCSVRCSRCFPDVSFISCNTLMVKLSSVKFLSGVSVLQNRFDLISRTFIPQHVCKCFINEKTWDYNEAHMKYSIRYHISCICCPVTILRWFLCLFHKKEGQNKPKLRSIRIWAWDLFHDLLLMFVASFCLTWCSFSVLLLRRLHFQSWSLCQHPGTRIQHLCEVTETEG